VLLKTALKNICMQGVERGEMLIPLKLFNPSIENNVRRFKKKKKF